MTQIADFTFYDADDNPLAASSVTNPDGDNPGGELPEHACDGVTQANPAGCNGCANTGHKWLDFNRGDLILTFDEAKQVGSWDW